MNPNNAIKEYAELQYSTPHFLLDRMNLWSYGSNPAPLHKWIFSILQLQHYLRNVPAEVLEKISPDEIRD